MPEATYSTGAAAQRLGISQHHVRRLCEVGLVDADQTNGGRWRVYAGEIERLLQEGVPPLPTPPTERPNPARPSPVIPRRPEQVAAPEPDESDDVRQARDSVSIVEYRLRRRRLELEAEQVEDQFHEREQTRQDEQEEAQRRQAQASASEARRQWLEGKIEAALNRLPADCPAEIQLNVQERIRTALKDLTPQSADGITRQAVTAAVETALEPYRASKRIIQAVESGIETLPIMAQYQDSPWVNDARRAARAAVTRLGTSEDAAAMRSAAIAAVKPIGEKFEHEETISKLLRDLLYWNLGTATDGERKAARKSAEAALRNLPAGADKEEMEEAIREALHPHDKVIRHRLKEAAREIKVRQIVDKGIARVSHHLTFGGWEFDSYTDRDETERDLKAELRPHLEELAEAGEITAADVKDYVEQWIDDELEEPSETDDED